MCCGFLSMKFVIAFSGSRIVLSLENYMHTYIKIVKYLLFSGVSIYVNSIILIIENGAQIEATFTV